MTNSMSSPFGGHSGGQGVARVDLHDAVAASRVLVERGYVGPEAEVTFGVLVEGHVRRAVALERLATRALDEVFERCRVVASAFVQREGFARSTAPFAVAIAGREPAKGPREVGCQGIEVFARRVADRADAGNALGHR
jgi:hypothetical protein